MSVAFVRQLGAQPGIQLNPLKDGSDGFAPDNSDQVFGIAMRAKRGRIDRCFKVNRGNLDRKLGTGDSIRASALNEARVQVFEALNSGAFEAVIHRLSTTAAALSYIVISADPSTGDLSYSVAAALPSTYLLALRHLECFNDGVIVEAHADSVRSAGVDVATKVLSLRLREPNGNLLFDFTGSLDVTAVDDFGKSAFIGDVLEAGQSVVDLEVTVSVGQTIKTTSNAYGRDLNGLDKVAKSATLIYFSEGGTGYAAQDYITARQRLSTTEFDFSYIASGGSQAPGLLVQLTQLAFDTNRQLRLDVPGSLTPTAAIAFVEQLNIDSYYCAAFWAPLRSDDPVSGGKAVVGTGGYHIGQSCLRNAATNALGFAPKNQAIAGKSYPLPRSGVKQIYDPTTFELNDLAKAKINPVLFQRYNGGGSYVFTDALTLARTEVSFRKLITVADMSSSIDDVVVRFGKEVLLLPMQLAITRMKTFLQRLFEGAQAASWLVPSQELNGAAFTFTVAPNQLRPADRMDVSYALHYDGTVRQIFVQQTITR